MANVRDVAAYILDKLGGLPAMKLQKLVYYSHAWHLVWDEKPLFTSRVEAWANGPVIPALYAAHRGYFGVNPGQVGGDSSHLTDSERETIDVVLRFYGDMSAHELSELTHREAPWVDARAGMEPMERGTREISHAAMAEYYDGLTTAGDD